MIEVGTQLAIPGCVFRFNSQSLCLALTFGLAACQGAEDFDSEPERDAPQGFVEAVDVAQFDITAPELDSEMHTACARPSSYWIAHNAYAAGLNSHPWPLSEDTMACDLSVYEWVTSDPTSDPFAALAREWTVANLNIMMGAPVPASTALNLAGAGDLLEECDAPIDDMIKFRRFTTHLTHYNNGRGGAPACQ